MELASRLSISYYREIAPINEAHRVFLTRHTESGKFFVKKLLTVYHAEIYRALLSSPMPGMPRIYALHEENGVLTVIEEYISGDTLEETLARSAEGGVSEAFAVDVTRQLCDILLPLHERKPPIVHRDIKPSNIMLTPSGKVFLLDFNAARNVLPEKAEDTPLLGTRGFAAPEQYGFGSSGAGAGIYALGIVLRTMLGDVTVSPFLAHIVKKCTRMDARARYRSVRSLKRALRSPLCAGGRRAFLRIACGVALGGLLLFLLAKFAAWVLFVLRIVHSIA